MSSQRLEPFGTPPVTAIVLAGGGSRRMGHDKALIPIAGVPLLRRVCQVALACTPQVLIVTPWPDRYRAIAPPPCEFMLEMRNDEQQPPGPLVGFAQGLTQVKTEWVLLLACDLPRLDPIILQRWQQGLGAVDPTAIAALVPSPAGWEPLCGFYRQRCLASLNHFRAQGGRSFQRWLAPEVVHILPTDAASRAMLLNCNTPEELAQCKETIGVDDK